jgi:CRISPR-associated endonuclease/helicase Cas3
VQINLLPLFSRLADIKATSGISLHQQATWDALVDPDVDAIINVAATGDGKSYAAFGAYPEGGVLAMYPTNELVRDQERQFATYYQNPSFRIQRLTGYDLEAWARTAKQSKAETLLDLAKTGILLTNPDLFYYLHQGNYIKDFIASGMGDRLDLWQQIDSKFRALIFDEFHIYQPSQVSGIINTLLLMRSVGIKHKYIFLSATPNRHLVKFLELAGLNYRIISGDYSTTCGMGWRQINQPVTLNLEPTTRAEQWIYENEGTIAQFFTQYPNSKGAIILNSIASVKRVRRRLAARLLPLGLTVSENTGFTDKDRVQEAIASDLIVGTSTLDVGIDFRINFLIFEGHDAPTFIQRLGRIGRHPGFPFYQAYALVPQYFVERMQLDAGDTCDRAELNKLVIKHHCQTNSFIQYYKRWSPIQALIIGQQLKGHEGANLYRAQIEQMYGQNLHKVYDLCSKWTQEAADLRTSNLIVQEAKSFRGTSSLQCAVLDWTGGKEYPTIKTYNLPGILGGFKYSALTQKEFIQKTGRRKIQLPSFVEHCRLFCEVFDLNEKYNPWSFYVNYSVEKIAGKLKILKGLSIYQDYGGNTKNFGLAQIRMCAFAINCPAEMIKSDLRLPSFFPLYPLKDNYSMHDRSAPYCIAFDQAALMLDAYLGQGELITREMIAHHSHQVLQSEIDEGDAFLEAYFSAKLMDEEWAESAEIRFTKKIPEDIFGFPIDDAIAAIRHGYTNYEEVLSSRWFKSDSAYLILKGRFNQAITLKYADSFR